MGKRGMQLLLAAALALLAACQSAKAQEVCEPAKAATPPPPSQQEQPTEASRDPKSTKETVSGEGFLTEIENQVLDLINKERRSLGLRELSYDPRLQNAARIRSKELCQDPQMRQSALAHQRPDGRSWETVLLEDIPIEDLAEAGEILARENSGEQGRSRTEPIPAKDWFLLWKASAPHYDTITWPEAEFVGVGIYYEMEDGAYYTNATVLFTRSLTMQEQEQLELDRARHQAGPRK